MQSFHFRPAEQVAEELRNTHEFVHRDKNLKISRITVSVHSTV